MPLTIQVLGDKLDQLTAGQAGYEDLLRRFAAGQEHHAAVLDLHTTKLNELVRGQNAHSELLRELIRGHVEQTRLLQQMLQASGEDFPHLQ